MHQQSNDGLPFAVAQTGRAFRNEIKPANGIIRSREFQLAEIQHFYDPEKSLENILDGKLDIVLPILTASSQLSGSGVVAESVKNLIDDNVASGTALIFLHKNRSYQTSLYKDNVLLRFCPSRPILVLLHFKSPFW